MVYTIAIFSSEVTDSRLVTPPPQTYVQIIHTIVIFSVDAVAMPTKKKELYLARSIGELNKKAEIEQKVTNARL